MTYYYLTETKKNQLIAKLNLVINGKKYIDILREKHIAIVPIPLEGGGYILPTDTYDEPVTKAIFDSLSFHTLTIKNKDQVQTKIYPPLQ